MTINSFEPKVSCRFLIHVSGIPNLQYSGYSFTSNTVTLKVFALADEPISNILQAAKQPGTITISLLDGTGKPTETHHFVNCKLVDWCVSGNYCDGTEAMQVELFYRME